MNRSHYIFISSEEGDRFHGAHGGTFSVSGSQYSETIEYSSIPDILGKSYVFAFRLEGDRWLMSGDFDGLKLEETWQRLK